MTFAIPVQCSTMQGRLTVSLYCTRKVPDELIKVEYMKMEDDRNFVFKLHSCERKPEEKYQARREFKSN